MVRILRREFVVQHFVLLPVISDEHPLDLRKLVDEPSQFPPFVIFSTSEKPVVRGAPVGQEERTFRVEVSSEETCESGRRVPCPRREIDDGGSRMVADEALEEHGHSRCCCSCLFNDNERVPGGDEWLRERGLEDRVIDIRDDAELCSWIDNEDGCFRLLLTGADRDRVPPGGKIHG